MPKQVESAKDIMFHEFVSCEKYFWFPLHSSTECVVTSSDIMTNLCDRRMDRQLVLYDIMMYTLQKVNF